MPCRNAGLLAQPANIDVDGLETRLIANRGTHIPPTLPSAQRFPAERSSLHNLLNPRGRLRPPQLVRHAVISASKPTTTWLRRRWRTPPVAVKPLQPHL